MNSRDMDLELLAVRYVTGELDDAEAATFEARLAEDQMAREAVEQAVLVGAAAVRTAVVRTVALSAASTVASPVGHTWRWRAAAAAILVVTIGLAVAVYSNQDRAGRSDAGTDGTSATTAEAQDLIASWVEFGDLPEATDPGMPFAERDQDLAETEDAFDFADTEALSWMMQALK